MKNRKTIIIAILTATIFLSFTGSANAAPCEDNYWQPTFVHDLVGGYSGPYYVHSSSGPFERLEGSSQRDWGNMACMLIDMYGIRDKRGYDGCSGSKYTLIQCGCNSKSKSNTTCANFIRFKGH